MSVRDARDYAVDLLSLCAFAAFVAAALFLAGVA